MKPIGTLMPMAARTGGSKGAKRNGREQGGLERGCREGDELVPHPSTRLVIPLAAAPAANNRRGLERDRSRLWPALEVG